MRFSFPLLFFLTAVSSWSQFQFQGQVSELYKNQPVYLSLIEDYRKTGRVYLDQIIQKTVADSLGHFTFTGEELPLENRFYRIHADGCDEERANQLQFMGQCPTTISILFIANNRDTISLPLGNSSQEFCEIASTNAAAPHLLEFEVLKEKMVLDFVKDEGTPLADNLKFNKWFKAFHDFAKSTKEPLVELFVYSFLSNRTNETSEPYAEYLGKKNILAALAVELNDRYPDTKYTSLFYQELVSDFQQTKFNGNRKWHWTDFKTIILIAFAFLIATLLYIRTKRKIEKSGYKSLSPQEKKVCDAILEGKTNNEIALEFFISLSTVKTHVNNIYKKLAVSSRQELKDKF